MHRRLRPRPRRRGRAAARCGEPWLDLRAITTVAGNGELDKVTRNALRVCALAGIRDVPVAAGAERPLVRALETAADVHGESALDGPDLPEPEVPLDPRPAHRLMADVAAASPDPVTLIAIGPLTNVATALERHPEIAGALREIIVMGGSTDQGNRTPYAEFNIWVDPEAAEQVFASGVPVTMVGLNVTHQALATPPVVERLRALDSDVARAVVAVDHVLRLDLPRPLGLRRAAGPRRLRRRARNRPDAASAASSRSSPSRPGASGPVAPLSSTSTTACATRRTPRSRSTSRPSASGTW